WIARACSCSTIVFFFQAEDGIRDDLVTGVQTCALPISRRAPYAYTLLIAWNALGLLDFAVALATGFSIVGTFASQVAAAGVAPEIGRAACRESAYVSWGGGGL